jgi:type VI secretion system protein ImpB
VPESIFDRKARVRPPRVHITYEVETGGASALKEIPFVLGVLADLSGQPLEPLPRLKERGFTEIDRDSFDDVLRSARPRVALRVPDALAGEGELAVDLQFEALADFRPESVARQVQPLAELLEVRSLLKDLLVRLEGNERLAELLQAAASNEVVRAKLRGALAAALGAGGGH